MKIHDLKCQHDFFADVQSGRKTFELRYDDRGYNVGDILDLYDYDADTGSYLGPMVTRKVTCMLGADDTRMDVPLMPGWCILGIMPLQDVSSSNPLSDEDILFMATYCRLRWEAAGYIASPTEQVDYLMQEFGYSRNQAYTIVRIGRRCMDSLGRLQPMFAGYRVSQLAVMVKLSERPLVSAVMSGELQSSMSLKEIQNYISKYRCEEI